MVGRFESPELTRDALAYEELCARAGPAGCCVSLLAAGIVLTGAAAFLPSLGSLAPAASPASRSSASAPPIHPALDEDLDWHSSFASSYGSPGFGGGADSKPGHPPPPPGLGLDFSLMTIVIALVACCLLPSIFRLTSGPGAWSPAAAPWGGPSQSQGPGGPGPPLRQSNSAGNPFAPDMLSGGRGCLVDVKPGDLRGAGTGSGAFYGGSGVGAGANWNWQGGPCSTALFPNAGITPQDWQQGAANPPGGFISTLGSSLGSTFGSAFSAAFGALGGHHRGVLPSEAEVTETYAAFGVEMQAWAPALAAFLDNEITALIRALDESDLQWQQALAPRGWRLTAEAPRIQGYALGPSTQDLSVFDRFLPRPWCDEPMAVEKWNQRQKLESYLVHPSFEPAQRQYVLERLREWRQRGLASGMRCEYRPNDLMPTDAHILENLIVKSLDNSLDFADCFLSSGHSPPQAKLRGEPATAYLRQVTDQNTSPKAAPHYEVVTMQKTWRIRAGNANILEALALFLHALRRHGTRSYQSFPQTLRVAFEGAASGAPAGSGPARLDWSY